MSTNIRAYSYTIDTDTTGQVRGLLLSRWGVVLISQPQPTTDDAWRAARELYDRWCSSWFSSQRDEATITAALRRGDERG